MFPSATWELWHGKRSLCNGCGGNPPPPRERSAAGTGGPMLYLRPYVEAPQGKRGEAQNDWQGR